MIKEETGLICSRGFSLSTQESEPLADFSWWYQVETPFMEPT